MIADPEYKIGRPRQLFTGAAPRKVVPIAEAGLKPLANSMQRTLYDKLWDEHVVHTEDDGTARALHRPPPASTRSPARRRSRASSIAGRKVWRVSANLAVSDHNVPTTDRRDGIADPISKLQVDTLDANCDRLGVTQFKMNDKRQGIVHVIGPEQGATLPGMTVVCGDSHTSTHGAFGALAHGIGTSEVEHVLATQTLLAKKAKNLLVRVEGTLPRGCSAKDIVLAVIGKIGTAGGTGYTIEFAGSAIRALSMEGRMTVCNMAIEAGARAGLVAVDETTHRLRQGPPVLAGRRRVGAGASRYWRTLHSDAGAHFDRGRRARRRRRSARRSPGARRPRWCCRSSDRVPDPEREKDAGKRGAMERALTYMALEPNKRDRRHPHRQGLHRLVHQLPHRGPARGRGRGARGSAARIAGNVKLALVVPGSGLVKEQAEREGLDKVFNGAGFEWREPGCSMCLAMNADRLEPGERCASTSNRNFEGRQGAGGRTHLVSPAMAAAAAHRTATSSTSARFV